MICLLALTSSGCTFCPRITPANQDVGLVVRHVQTRAPISGALVGSEFPAKDGLSQATLNSLEYQRVHGQGLGSTDADGHAKLPVLVTGPRSGPGPDQITDGPITFRVEHRGIVEYLHDPDLHVGDVVKGSHFELEIQSIGMPYARYPRKNR